MKRIILAVAALMVFSSPARAQPITGAGGLQRVIHDNTLTGEGTTPHPLSVVGAATYISGTLTSPKLVVATGAHTVGDFGGSDPGACPAGQADTHPALAASGTLTKSCSVFVNAAGAGLSLSGSSISMPNTGPGVSTVTYATITTDVQGRVTASSSGAAPALASTTITAGNGLTGGGDLSANRTIDVGAGLGILSNANDVAIDPTYTQRRVTGTCSDPFGIITIAQDGTVTCSTTTVGSSVGTANTFPIYTAARTLGNSPLLYDGSALISTVKNVQVGGSSAATLNLIDLAAAGVPANMPSGAAAMNIVQPGGAGLLISRPSASASSPRLSFYKTRSTDNTRVAVTNGDPLGDIHFEGASDGTTDVQTAEIKASVTGTVASGSIPTGLFFYTGTTSAVQALSLNSDQTSTFAGQMDLGSHKIVNVTNGASAQDAAAFGQISSAVTTAVSGTIGDVPRFTATNAIGNGSMVDDGAATVSIPKISSVAVHYVGDFPGNATDVKNGYEVTAYSDGNNYIDSKVQSTRSTIFRTGAGAQSGATTTYETVTGSSGAITWAAAQTMSTTLSVATGSTLKGTSQGISNPAAGAPLVVVDTTAAAQGDGGQIVFYGNYTGSTNTQYAAITAYKESATVDGSQYGASLIFNTRVQGGNNTEKMRIDNAGHVGIATATNSTHTLEVNGDAVFDSTLTVSGSAANPALNSTVISWFQHTGSSPDFYVAGKSEFGLAMTLDNHLINHIANGVASDDAAAFGQIASGINAAVSCGTSNALGRFTSTNAIGCSSTTDDGASAVRTGKSSSQSHYTVGDDTGVTTAAQSGYSILAYSDGSIYIDSKTIAGGTTKYRLGDGAQSGATTLYETVTNSSGAVTWAAAQTMSSTLNVTGDSIVNKLTVNGKASDNSLTVNFTQTAQTLGLAALTESNTGTFDTTGGALTSTGGSFSVTSTRSAGGSNLTNRAAYFNASGAQLNKAIVTDNGNVEFNDISGTTTVNGAFTAAVGVSLNTVSGTTAITGHGATNLSVADASTAIAADITNVSSTNSATLNTTAAGRNAYGLYVANSSAISSGANTLTSIGAYIDDTTSGANTTVYSLYTDHGDVRLNATNGVTGVKGPFQVDNTNSSKTATSATINFTSTAVVGDGYGEQVSQSGTFDLTAANRAAYGLKISNTAAKSAGNNSLSVFGLYVDTSGAGVTNVTSNQGVFSNGGDIAVASSATTTHELKVNGHENTGGTALVNGDLSACGTGTPTVGAGSTDMAGLITEGTTATGCTLTFKATYTNAPFCSCTGETSGSAAVLVGCSTTATTLVVANASATGDKIYFQCIGQRGGS